MMDSNSLATRRGEMEWSAGNFQLHDCQLGIAARLTVV